MNNELIKIETNENGMPAVRGRDLHEFLNINTQYSIWFSRILEYGFTENLDFKAIVQKRLTAQKNETTYINHIISLDMAKEIAMLQRSEKGKQARKYFIEIEKKYNDPEYITLRALEYQKKKIEKLELENKEQALLIQEQAPKVAFANAYTSSEKCMLVRDFAKYLTQNNIEIGEKRLFQWLRGNGYLCQNNAPTQKAMELDLFNMSAGTYTNSKGDTINTHATKLTPKGQVYFLKKFKEMPKLSIH